MQIERLKTFIQSANINFLFGSGLSVPYLSTLNNIEKWLTNLNAESNNFNKEKIVEASLYKAYFEKVIYPNLEIGNDVNYRIVLKNYKDFLTIWNDIANKRADKLHSKQLNIYSTNIDVFVEKAAEDVAVEFNDGFKGSIRQIFDESNFQKSFVKRSLHYQNSFEIPVYNLLKMHGSINWSEKDNKIYNDSTLNQIKTICEKIEKIDKDYFIEIGNDKNVGDFIAKANEIVSKYPSVDFDNVFNDFLIEYHKLIMVNPTKHKFKETVIDVHFYELMRMFSNSLEKENTILLVMGFSFEDEHIREIVMRAANTNPTLEIIILSYNDDYEHSEMASDAKNSNIRILCIKDFKDSQKDNEIIKDKIKDWKNFDFETINKLFSIVNESIPAIYEKRK